MAANIPSAEAGETKATAKNAAAKLPRHIVPLPEDVPESAWKLWPRQVEAHLLWPQARERQITNKVKAGALPCYYCPDGSCRINREHMIALWGEPDASTPKPNPLSAAGREERGDDGSRRPRVHHSDLELDDPVVGMFRECREMLKSSNDFNLQLIKSLMDPIAEQMKLLTALTDRLGDRVEFLENKQDAVMSEREALADFRHARDVEIAATRAKEERRGKLLALLQSQVPDLIKAWAGGASLADFVEDLDPALVDMVLNSGTLPERRAVQLKAVALELERKRAERAAAAAAAKAAAEQQSNGAAPSPPATEAAS